MREVRRHTADEAKLFLGVTTVSDPSAPAQRHMFGNYSSPPVVESAQPQAVASGVAGVVPGPAFPLGHSRSRRSCRFTAAGSRRSPHRRRPEPKNSRQLGRPLQSQARIENEASQTGDFAIRIHHSWTLRQERAHHRRRRRPGRPHFSANAQAQLAAQSAENYANLTSALCRGRIGLPFRTAPLRSPHKGEQFV